MRDFHEAYVPDGKKTESRNAQRILSGALIIPDGDFALAEAIDVLVQKIEHMRRER